MSTTGENVLLSLTTILAIIVIPPFLLYLTPLGRLVKHKRKQFLERLDQSKRSKPKQVTLPHYPVPALQLSILISALLLIFGVPVFLGKIGGNALPRVFHFGPAAVFPLEGEFILMATLVFLAAASTLLLEAGIIFLVPKLGVYLAAEKTLQQLIYFGVGHKTTNQAERHQQIEQIAGEYDLRSLALQNIKRISRALIVILLLTIPVFIWISRTGVWVDNARIVVNPLFHGPLEYTWEEVSGIEISIEDISTRNTRYSPSFKILFNDQTSIDVWAASFVNLTQELKDTCRSAQTHNISIYISPLVTGRLSHFNQRAQKEILSVVESPSCRTDAYTLQF